MLKLLYFRLTVSDTCAIMFTLKFEKEHTMTNPNNCNACEYKRINEQKEGHCYMFRNAPSDICMQHTQRKNLEVFSTHSLAEVISLFKIGKTVS